MKSSQQERSFLRTIIFPLIFLAGSLSLLAWVSRILRTCGIHDWLWAVLIFLVIFFLFLLWKVPEWQIASLKKTSEPEKLVTLKNELRKTLAQIMGGLLILISLYGTWKTLEISKQTAEDNLKVSHQNLKISQEGQITERFTRAVEHLGNAKLEIRLGGIYALERISKDSPKDCWQVMDILSAYVRENSPNHLKQYPLNILDKDAKGKLGKFPSSRGTEGPPIDIQEVLSSMEAEKLPIDIQAILSVIVRRTLNYEKGAKQSLNSLVLGS